MNEDSSTTQASSPAQPRWQPVGAIDRRVLGVLAEKAKTTPDVYPMSLNALSTGCNQKSNRFPLMQLGAEDVEAALERLRGLGAAGVVEGYGRVVKYRHYLYEWLGVEKVELAVMTELLLRGPQTEGELRGRVARMEPIADLPALRSVLEALRSKGLVVSLTPEGRGHVVTHALYPPRELEQLRTQYAPGRVAGEAVAAGIAPQPASEAATGAPAAAASPAALVAALRRDIDELRTALLQLQGEVRELADRQGQLDQQMRGLKDALGG